MNLNISNWKPFLLKDLYEITMGDKLDKNKMSDESPSINFISRISYNNGVDGKVDRITEKKPHEPGLLTVSLGGEYLGSCYIQKDEFYTAQNVAILRPLHSQMSLNVNLFISTLVKFECQTKYYAFGRELNTHIDKDFEINLPVLIDKDGKHIIKKGLNFSEKGYIPDWDFMENYIESLNLNSLKTKNKNCHKKLETNKWKEFKVSKILTLKNGKGITIEEIEKYPGNLRAIQSGEENNGIIGYIDLNYCIKKNYIFTTKPCLTVARTGSAGYVSFQRNGCVVGDSAKILMLEEKYATIENYLFIQTILLMNKFKYDYGRKVTESNYLNDIIRLPILIKDNQPVIDNSFKYSKEGFIPDWEFMTEYIRNLPYGDILENINFNK